MESGLNDVLHHLDLYALNHAWGCVAVLVVFLLFLAVCCHSARKCPVEELYYTPESGTLKEPLCQSWGSNWTAAEAQCVALMLAEADESSRPPDSMLLQVAWARRLDAKASLDLWRKHLEQVELLGIVNIKDADVVEAYSAGFCVRCGHDAEGRPLIWVRLALSEPAKLGPRLPVLNTWLALDAALSGGDEASRRGVCFVYDLNGVGGAFGK